MHGFVHTRVHAQTDPGFWSSPGMSEILKILFIFVLIILN